MKLKVVAATLAERISIVFAMDKKTVERLSLFCFTDNLFIQNTGKPPIGSLPVLFYFLTNRTPRVPGPQWQETVQPATVS